MNKIEKESDWELIKCVKAGDEAACVEIMRRYERLLFYIPKRYGLDPVESADIVQQTFLAMLERIDSFHPESNLKGWFSVVCKRQCWERLKQFDNEDVHHEALTDSVLLMGHAAQENNHFATVEWLLDGLDLLDERCRNLILMLYFSENEVSYEDVAAEIGIKVGSVGPTRGRCLKKLKNGLQRVS